MSPRPVREKQQKNLAESIKDVAFEQIARGGPTAVSLRAIARRLGITAPAIYNYFPDRGALIAAMAVDAFTSFGAALENARDACDISDWSPCFLAIGVAYRQWALEHAQQYRLIFGTPHESLPHPHELGSAPLRSFLVLVGVMNEAIRAGALRLPQGYVGSAPGLKSQFSAFAAAFPDYRPEAIYLGLEAWTKIHGIVSLELSGHLSSFVGGGIEDFVRSTMNGYAVQLRNEGT